MAFMALLPPWVFVRDAGTDGRTEIHAGYRPVFHAPKGGFPNNPGVDYTLAPKINICRLLVQYMAVISIAGGVFVLQQDRR
jgi:hypothetical protein